MITTVTLNASIDKLYTVEDVTLDTVMRVQEVCNTAGGKGLNVAKVARTLGEKTRAMGFVGGYNGQYLRSLLRAQDIEDAFTPVEGETRSCINIRNLTTGSHTEFLEPGAPITQENAQAFYESFLAALPKSRVVTISGSVPAGTPAGFYARLIAAAKAAENPVLLDTSGRLLCDAVAGQPTLIKPNADEITQLLGTSAASQEEIVRAARRLHEGGIAFVVVSMGAKGSLMVCEQGVFRATPPKLTVVNSVGCGDSMIAGFAVGMRRGYAPEELLSFATAVSAANALSVQTGCVNPDDLPALHEQVRIERV